MHTSQKNTPVRFWSPDSKDAVTFPTLTSTFDLKATAVLIALLI